jgi:hypothetical protein
MEICSIQEPVFEDVEKDHLVACWLHQETGVEKLPAD